MAARHPLPGPRCANVVQQQPRQHETVSVDEAPSAGADDAGERIDEEEAGGKQGGREGERTVAEREGGGRPNKRKRANIKCCCKETSRITSILVA